MNYFDEKWFEKQDATSQKAILENRQLIDAVPDKSFLLMRDGRLLLIFSHTTSSGVVMLQETPRSYLAETYFISKRSVARIGRIVKPNDSEYKFLQDRFLRQ